MNFLNKKGEDVHFAWIVGTLSGVLIGSILLSLGLQWYATTAKTGDSFDALIAKIESLKDKESTSMAYFLPDGYILVSFTEGNDFMSGTYDILGQSYVTGQSCAGTIRIPESCGSEDCLCVCDGSYEYGYEDACIEDPLQCHPFTSEATKDFFFRDTECNSGVYRQGPENGVFTLYLEREGSIIQFCSIEGCVTEEQKEAIEATEKLLVSYESCANNRESCSCSIDWTYFKEHAYALHFEGKSVQLLDLEENQEIYTAELSIPASTEITGFSSEIYAYVSELYTVVVGTTYQANEALPDLSYTRSETLVISPSQETMDVKRTTSETVKIVAENLYKKSESLSFVEDTFDFANLPSCTETETSSDQEIIIV